MAGGAAVGGRSFGGWTAPAGAFSALNAGRWRRGGEGGPSVGGAPAVFAAITLASQVDDGVYEGFALAVGAERRCVCFAHGVVFFSFSLAHFLLYCLADGYEKIIFSLR